MREQSHDPVIPRASLSAIPGAAQSLQPFPQSPILRLQLSNQLDELSPLVPQLGELFNFFRSHKRVHLMNVVSRAHFGSLLMRSDRAVGFMRLLCPAQRGRLLTEICRKTE